ncbi:hypothetical protein RNJ44_02391 [Nakaseomyces bracarensis]|uniref:Peptidase S8/S53 domain-containing protein n=1 Tax=Nakaseomyces bracarensis TaxID=273131 RepID=A0ABR4NLI8_9SACH
MRPIYYFWLILMLSMVGGIVLPNIDGLKTLNCFVSPNNQLPEKAPFYENKQLAPLFRPSYNDAELDYSHLVLIAHRYIVIFKDFAYTSEMQKHIEEVNQFLLSDIEKSPSNHPFLKKMMDTENSISGGIIKRFDLGLGFKGYTGYFTSNTLRFIREKNIVEYVEMDSEIHINEKEVTGNSPWQLARSSHRNTLDLTTYREYVWDNTGTGSNVDVYVLDTGIFVENPFLAGKVSKGINTVQSEQFDDLNGHGTQMAGLIATEFGAAPDAIVWDIKVLNWQGRGLVSNIIHGLEYAINNHHNQIAGGYAKASVLLFAISGPRSKALDRAMDKVVSNGLHVVVGAGSRGIDACQSSPAASKKPITVSAMTILDTPLKQANWGSCVDLYAPGDRLLTTWPNRAPTLYKETNYITGSSAAAAHVAGVVAYFLSLAPTKSDNTIITPTELKTSIKNLATRNKLHPKLTRDASFDLLDYDNLIIFNGGGLSLEDFFGQPLESSTTVTSTPPSSVDPTEPTPTPDPTDPTPPPDPTDPIDPNPVNPEPEDPSEPDPENPNLPDPRIPNPEEPVPKESGPEQPDIYSFAFRCIKTQLSWFI